MKQPRATLKRCMPPDECIAIRIERKLKAVDVIDVLSDLFITRGVPEHVRSDNVLHKEVAAIWRQKISFPQHAAADL